MTEHTAIAYNDFTADIGKLPPASLHRLASYGFAHYLGNQASSKVVAWKDKDENKNATDEQVAAFKSDVQAKMFAAILDGTMGVHATRGPSVDPEEAEAERLAKAEIITTLKANNIKVPKKEEKVQFADGREKSMDEMIETRLGHAEHGPRLRTEAKASLKAKQKAKDALAKKVATMGVDL